MRNSLIAIIAVVLVGGGFWYLTQFNPTTPGGGVACTMEAMQCPDGSWVGRTGPNCEFVCPAATTSTGGGSGGGILPYQSGIRGTLMLGPTCPVERNPPDPACADKPYQTLVAVYRASDPVHAFVLTQSDAQGKFEASLPPGDYTVGAGQSSLPRCPTTTATVGSDVYTSITIQCDTGIR